MPDSNAMAVRRCPPLRKTNRLKTFSNQVLQTNQVWHFFRLFFVGLQDPLHSSLKFEFSSHGRRALLMAYDDDWEGSVDLDFCNRSLMALQLPLSGGMLQGSGNKR